MAYYNNVFQILTTEQKSAIEQLVTEWVDNNKSIYNNINRSIDAIPYLFEDRSFEGSLLDLVEEILENADFNNWKFIPVYNSNIIDIADLYEKRNVSKVLDIRDIWDMLGLVIYSNLHRYIEVNISNWV